MDMVIKWSILIYFNSGLYWLNVESKFIFGDSSFQNKLKMKTFCVEWTFLWTLCSTHFDASQLIQTISTL
uniref:Uncharacterized protein n=1 Tax=Tetranychus urticae TaxID=32264 RepID=T1JW03_TETUR